MVRLKNVGELVVVTHLGRILRGVAGGFRKSERKIAVTTS